MLKIDSEILFLDIFKLNMNLCNQLAETFNNLVPARIRTLNFMGNEITDFEFKIVLSGLYETHGLEVLSSMQNAFGPQSVYVLKQLLEGESLQNLRKLVFKDTNYVAIADSAPKNSKSNNVNLGKENYSQLSSLFHCIA